MDNFQDPQDYFKKLQEKVIKADELLNLFEAKKKEGEKKYAKLLKKYFDKCREINKSWEKKITDLKNEHELLIIKQNDYVNEVQIKYQTACQEVEDLKKIIEKHENEENKISGGVKFHETKSNKIIMGLREKCINFEQQRNECSKKYAKLCLEHDELKKSHKSNLELQNKIEQLESSEKHLKLLKNVLENDIIQLKRQHEEEMKLLSNQIEKRRDENKNKIFEEETKNFEKSLAKLNAQIQEEKIKTKQAQTYNQELKKLLENHENQNKSLEDQLATIKEESDQNKEREIQKQSQELEKALLDEEVLELKKNCELFEQQKKILKETGTQTDLMDIYNVQEILNEMNDLPSLLSPLTSSSSSETEFKFEDVIFPQPLTCSVAVGSNDFIPSFTDSSTQLSFSTSSVSTDTSDLIIPPVNKLTVKKFHQDVETQTVESIKIPERNIFDRIPKSIEKSSVSTDTSDLIISPVKKLTVKKFHQDVETQTVDSVIKIPERNIFDRIPKNIKKFSVAKKYKNNRNRVLDALKISKLNLKDLMEKYFDTNSKFVIVSSSILKSDKNMHEQNTSCNCNNHQIFAPQNYNPCPCQVNNFWNRYRHIPFYPIPCDFNHSCNNNINNARKNYKYVDTSSDSESDENYSKLKDVLKEYKHHVIKKYVDDKYSKNHKKILKRNLRNKAKEKRNKFPTNFDSFPSLSSERKDYNSSNNQNIETNKLPFNLGNGDLDKNIFEATFDCSKLNTNIGTQDLEKEIQISIPEQIEEIKYDCRSEESDEDFLGFPSDTRLEKSEDNVQTDLEVSNDNNEKETIKKNSRIDSISNLNHNFLKIKETNKVFEENKQPGKLIAEKTVRERIETRKKKTKINPIYNPENSILKVKEMTNILEENRQPMETKIDSNLEDNILKKKNVQTVDRRKLGESQNGPNNPTNLFSLSKKQRSILQKITSYQKRPTKNEESKEMPTSKSNINTLKRKIECNTEPDYKKQKKDIFGSDSDSDESINSENNHSSHGEGSSLAEKNKIVNNESAENTNLINAEYIVPDILSPIKSQEVKKVFKKPERNKINLPFNSKSLQEKPSLSSKSKTSVSLLKEIITSFDSLEKANQNPERRKQSLPSTSKFSNHSSEEINISKPEKTKFSSPLTNKQKINTSKSEINISKPEKTKFSSPLTNKQKINTSKSEINIFKPEKTKFSSPSTNKEKIITSKSRKNTANFLGELTDFKSLVTNKKQKNVQKIDLGIAQKLICDVVTQDWNKSLIFTVTEYLANKDTSTVVRLIIDQAAKDVTQEFDKSFTPPAPLLTKSQQKIIVLVDQLEKNNLNNIYSVFLDTLEKKLLLERRLEVVHSLTRLFVTLCKLKYDMERVRIFCCNASYYKGHLFTPIMFIVLTIWGEILPLAASCEDVPLAVVLVTVIQSRPCHEPGYNSKNLNRLLSDCYGYKVGENTSDDVMKKLVQMYSTSYSNTTYTAILLLCKNFPNKWTYTQIKKYLLPLLDSNTNSNENKRKTVCLIQRLLDVFSSKVDPNYIVYISEIKNLLSNRVISC